MELTLSKKQNRLLQDIIKQDTPEIYVLGSTQSGKTFDICLGVILYIQELHKYDPYKLYYGAIIGWAVDTIKSNIVDVIEDDLNKMGFKKKNQFGAGDYELKWGTGEKYLKFLNVKIFFFGFNTVLSFNKILGKPLIFEWVDESARIYSSPQLQKSFDEFPGRQMSYAGHPYLKTIHSFNVEGNENHPYKKKYIDSKPNALHYTFFPYDNPVLNNEKAIAKVREMFPEGSLRQQKVFNQWVVAEGKVFNQINKLEHLENIQIREIGIGCDYGSVNPTTFVPIAICYMKTGDHFTEGRWILVRLGIYYHDPKECSDTPTTDFYVQQFKWFCEYLKTKYPNIPITDFVIDSEASHYDNALTVANVQHDLAYKPPGSVDNGVQHLQSLFHKNFLYIYEEPSVKQILPNGQVLLCGKDEGLLELESYQYDSIRSTKEGTNCYKKELDHSVDATRYIIDKFRRTGRCPEV